MPLIHIVNIALFLFICINTKDIKLISTPINSLTLDNKISIQVGTPAQILLCPINQEKDSPFFESNRSNQKYSTKQIL